MKVEKSRRDITHTWVCVLGVLELFLAVRYRKNYRLGSREPGKFWVKDESERKHNRYRTVYK
jgi:hypothetical protein